MLMYSKNHHNIVIILQLNYNLRVYSYNYTLSDYTLHIFKFEKISFLGISITISVAFSSNLSFHVLFFFIIMDFIFACFRHIESLKADSRTSWESMTVTVAVFSIGDSSGTCKFMGLIPELWIQTLWVWCPEICMLY